MVRLRTAWVSRQSTKEIETYFRKRAWHFTSSGNYAIAADYIIRLLNIRPSDIYALILGEITAQHTRQEIFATKCKEAQYRQCVRRNTNDILQLISDIETRKTLAEWRIEAQKINNNISTIKEEHLIVKETESLQETQKAVESMAQRVHQPSLVQLLEPKQSIYGRGIFATSFISSGTSVMADTPFLVQRMRDGACAHCLITINRNSNSNSNNGRVITCPHCESETYCSSACREAAWREYHSCCCAATNKTFAAWEKSMVEQLDNSNNNNNTNNNNNNDNARAALCCLAVAKITAMATVKQEHPLALARIKSLRGKVDYDAETALSEIGAFAITLSTALKQTHLYMEEILSLFAIVQTNEFVLPNGIALYQGFSFLNHSCEPNCAIVGKGARDRKLVTLRDIREGEQLMINYNSNLTTCVSYEDRRALCQQRHFECFCPKCVRRE